MEERGKWIPGLAGDYLLFLGLVPITRKKVVGMIKAQSVFESPMLIMSKIPSASEVETAVVASIAEASNETEIQMTPTRNTRISLRLIRPRSERNGLIWEFCIIRVS